MKNIAKMYKEYISRNTILLVVSVLLSLHIEPVSFFIYLGIFGTLENNIESVPLKVILYIILNLIIPVMLSKINTDKMRLIIDKYSPKNKSNKYKNIIFMINLSVFSFGVTVLITVFGESMAPLLMFDIVRVPLLYFR